MGKIKLNLDIKKEKSYADVVREILEEYIEKSDVDKLMFLINKRWREVKNDNNNNKGYV